MNSPSPEPELRALEDDKRCRQFTIKRTNGTEHALNEKELQLASNSPAAALEDQVSVEELLESSICNFYEGMKESEVDQANILAARAKIEMEPAYSKVASRLLLDVLYRETMGISASDPSLESAHREYFKKYLKKAISVHRVHPDLLEFDLDKLARAMQLQRDDQFSYLGLQTLYDRYFIHDDAAPLRDPADLLDARRHGPCAIAKKSTKMSARSNFTMCSPSSYLSPARRRSSIPARSILSSAHATSRP